MRRSRTVGLISAGALLLGGLGGLTAAAPGASGQTFGYAKLSPVQKRHVSGALAEELGPQRTPNAVTGARPAAQPNCDVSRGADVKVNQNCLTVADQSLAGRSQAQNETSAAANPGNPAQVISAYNDYRRGDGTCGVSYSGNAGRTWADTTTPNGFVSGAAFGGTPREYLQSSGDTSVAWDTRGNAYLTCLQFDRGSGATPDADQSSGIYVYRSTGNGGASFNFPGRPVAEHNDVAGAGNFLLDKPLMAVDDHATSPYRDRVYVTFTVYPPDGTAYIYGAYSSDYGEHFSTPTLISSDSALCGQAYGIPTPQGRCNDNQFSDPVTASDGTLYVTWSNYNTAQTGADNHFQIMAARSTDGGKTFSSPVKVGTYYDLPDCDTYQGAGKDTGRDCVPEKGAGTNSVFRATNYPYVAVDPANPKRVAVTYGSYVNRDTAGCTPAGLTPFASGLGSLYTGVKTGGCNNGIIVSTSTDGGGNFTGTGTDVRSMPVVGDNAGQSRSDQFWQGMAFSPKGTLAVGYYDRQYGSDESTGYSDITLSTSKDLFRRAGGAPIEHFVSSRVTSSSMPPPSEFNGQFYGDYIMVTATATHAYPVWSDTRAAALFLCPGTATTGNPPQLCNASARNASIANHEDIYTAAVPIP